MFNYEWQKHIKQKYLDLAHAMQMSYRGNDAVILKDIEAANGMIKACSEYIAEQKAFLRGKETLMTDEALYRLLELLSEFDCTYELNRVEHDAITIVLDIVGREYYKGVTDDDS